jgi:hypothetical protein
MKNGDFPSFFVCLPEGSPSQLTWAIHGAMIRKALMSRATRERRRPRSTIPGPSDVILI